MKLTVIYNNIRDLKAPFLNLNSFSTKMEARYRRYSEYFFFAAGLTFSY